MQLLLCILASVGGIFLKIPLFHFTRFQLKPAFPILGFQEMDLPKISTPVAPHTLPTFGMYWSYSTNN